MLSSARNVLGDTIGRYQLLVQIGQGGMAEVFLARLRGAAGFAKLVVLKRMHSHLSHDKRFIELFINEGRMVAQLSHPHICQVHELGEEEGSLFLVMEYLNGVPWEAMARALPRGSPQELPLIAGVLGQACDGLHYAHQLRDHAGNPTPVVHRDVSPQNLFLTTDGICKVLDFGVAKMQTSDRYSHTGVVLGKLPYMAPEQICGQPVDPRTDVFAMGAVLWEALTGDRLFLRKSDYLIWKAINEDPIPSVLERRPELPKAVDAVVQRALQRDPAERFQTIQAFAQELRAAVVPGPFATHAIGDALRQLCAAQLAESSAIVSTALTELDRPAEQRAPLPVEEGAGDTLISAPLASVMLRQESVAQLVAPARRRRGLWRGAVGKLRELSVWLRWGRWRGMKARYLVIPAAMLVAVIAAVVTHDEPAGSGAAQLAARGAAKAAAGGADGAADAGAVSDAASPDAASGAVDAGAAGAGGAAGAIDEARDAGAAGAGGAAGVGDDTTTPGDDKGVEASAAATDRKGTADADDSSRRKRPGNRATRPGRTNRTSSRTSNPTSQAGQPTSPGGAEAELSASRVEAAPRFGHYSVDSKPYATITIDGVAHGETPLYRVQLSAGTHQVRAVRQDGATKTFSITIPAGKEVSSGRLKW